MGKLLSLCLKKNRNLNSSFELDQNYIDDVLFRNRKTVDSQFFENVRVIEGTDSEDVQLIISLCPEHIKQKVIDYREQAISEFLFFHEEEGNELAFIFYKTYTCSVCQSKTYYSPSPKIQYSPKTWCLSTLCIIMKIYEYEDKHIAISFLSEIAGRQLTKRTKELLNRQ